jgi:hypothetical protein
LVLVVQAAVRVAITSTMELHRLSGHTLMALVAVKVAQIARAHWVVVVVVLVTQPVTQMEHLDKVLLVAHHGVAIVPQAVVVAVVVAQLAQPLRLELVETVVQVKTLALGWVNPLAQPISLVAVVEEANMQATAPEPVV